MRRQKLRTKTVTYLPLSDSNFGEQEARVFVLQTGVVPFADVVLRHLRLVIDVRVVDGDVRVEVAGLVPGSCVVARELTSGFQLRLIHEVWKGGRLFCFSSRLF